MSNAVLQSNAQVSRAARWLKNEFGFIHADSPKAWDLREILQFILHRVPTKARIIDLGAVGCPITVLLASKGYHDLVALDLHASIRQRIPFWVKGVQFKTGDLHQTPFENASTDCLTCISVIEHGVNIKRFAAEAARLLKKGGYLLLSFDYWPTKINTTGISAFGLPWRIFSEKEVKQMVTTFKKHRLFPVQKHAFKAKKPLIHWQQKKYTFATLFLVKR